MVEEGVDGGGLMREFICGTLKTACERLFEDVGHDVHLLFPKDRRIGSSLLYEYTGMIVGKSLYEGIVTEHSMAPCILRKLLARSDENVINLQELGTIDPVFTKNLLLLKKLLDGDESFDSDTLGVNFVSSGEEERELLTGGKDVLVNKENLPTFAYLKTHDKINIQYKDQIDSFKKGFHSVVSCKWINMFSTAELSSMMAGGDHSDDIDVDDWMSNTEYSSGLSPDSPSVINFWTIVKDRMSKKDRLLLLEFCTACKRPPLFGFGLLAPRFCIAHEPQDEDGASERCRPHAGRLPTASTCVHMLKLPSYRDDVSLMESRLKYAIYSKSGFHLN